MINNPHLWTLARPLVNQIWRGGRHARLSILIYHRVLEAKDPLQPDIPDRHEFEWQMRLLRKHLSPLPMAEAIERLYAGDLPARAVCVSFDDGYADNLTVAAPILARLSVPATFFISTGFLNGGRMWNDTVIETLRRLPAGHHDLSALALGDLEIGDLDSRRQAIAPLLGEIKHLEYHRRAEVVAGFAERAGSSLPDDLMLTDAQLQSLASAGNTIGAHTLTHPILTRVSLDQARQEIESSKTHLESLLARPVELFAYPNGVPGQDYSPEHTRIVRDLGFKAAVSTAWGVSTRNSDPFQLPRFTPWDRQAGRFYARLVHNCTRTRTIAA